MRDARLPNYQTPMVSSNDRMASAEPITIVTAVNNREVLDSNLLVSPCLNADHARHIMVQEGFGSAALAYNNAIDRSQTDLMVFLHQDMILPIDWLVNFRDAVRYVEEMDPQWGVLGIYGMPVDGHGRGHLYSNGRGMLGVPFVVPQLVQTLDEIVLVLRKSSNLRFDDKLPHFHFYGTDICMAAAKQGRNSYVIPAFCVHNTQMNVSLPEEFYSCYKHIKKTWRQYLPIQTTCVRVTASDYPMYRRRIGEAYHQYITGRVVTAARNKSGLAVLSEVERTFPRSSESRLEDQP
jgi:hypothetical protein